MAAAVSLALTPGVRLDVADHEGASVPVADCDAPLEMLAVAAAVDDELAPPVTEAVLVSVTAAGSDGVPVAAAVKLAVAVLVGEGVLLGVPDAVCVCVKVCVPEIVFVRLGVYVGESEVETVASAVVEELAPGVSEGVAAAVALPVAVPVLVRLLVAAAVTVALRETLAEAEALAEALTEALLESETLADAERVTLALTLGVGEAITQLEPTHCQACRSAPVSGKEASSGEVGSGPKICSVCVAARAWQFPAPQTESSARLVNTMDVSCAAPRLTDQYSAAVLPLLL